MSFSRSACLITFGPRDPVLMLERLLRDLIQSEARFTSVLLIAYGAPPDLSPTQAPFSDLRTALRMGALLGQLDAVLINVPYIEHRAQALQRGLGRLAPTTESVWILTPHYGLEASFPHKLFQARPSQIGFSFLPLIEYDSQGTQRLTRAPAFYDRQRMMDGPYLRLGQCLFHYPTLIRANGAEGCTDATLDWEIGLRVSQFGVRQLYRSHENGEASGLRYDWLTETDPSVEIITRYAGLIQSRLQAGWYGPETLTQFQRWRTPDDPGMLDGWRLIEECSQGRLDEHPPERESPA